MYGNIHIVAGHMRSGTSMMMDALTAGGMDSAYSHQRDSFKNTYSDDSYDPNSCGLYELDTQEYNRLGFPRSFAGKLIKVIDRFPLRMAPMDRIDVVFMRRDPEEIRQSFHAFTGEWLDASVINEKMELLKEIILNRKDVATFTELWYRDVLDHPLSCFDELQRAGWPIDTEKCISVVDTNKIRYKVEDLIEGII